MMDCGPACLKMVARHYGRNVPMDSLRESAQANKEGTSLLGISEAAEKIGFKTRGVKIEYKQLVNEVTLPAILHWEQNHFVVLPDQRFNNNEITIADPARGVVNISTRDFKKNWVQSFREDTDTGIVLLLEPTQEFYASPDPEPPQTGLKSIFKYLTTYKSLLFKLSTGLLIGSLFQLIIPFLTQSIVDSGIRNQDMHFIYVIVIGQSLLFLSRTVIDFIRSRILIYISARINLSILSDFWAKLMRLPLHFFDTKKTGDILQRINDHKRIEQFLTGSSLYTMFSMLNFIVLSAVLLVYNWKIYLVFCTGSALYFLWIRLFLRERRKLDYKYFSISSRENSATMQLIYGMQEIKLNNAEQLHRWNWEKHQVESFNLSLKMLSLSQFQQTGAFFINEGRNILITLIVAAAVVEGHLTLGAMLAIQAIVGQLSSPVEQLISFVQQAQDARISLERLNEIHQMPDEESLSGKMVYRPHLQPSIEMSNTSFTYPGSDNEPVLDNINLKIPSGKITAIVGTSGSGKTTLLKLLLKFYDNYKGEIKVGDISLKRLSPKFWRSQCGYVLQDGYIFSDTIARNISVREMHPDYEKILEACRIANIQEFVDALPLGLNTIIGAEGKGISAGQRQRILIARAIYKNPQYLLFDEATNALDANNEKIIVENLANYFKGRTVIVVAHRLSTVKNSDNIIVLHHGRIMEQGTHDELTSKKGHYYELVKNQLELGN